MFSPRTAPRGAVCLWLSLCAFAPQALAALPANFSAPPAVRDAVHRVLANHPRIQSADAVRRAALANARAAAQPVYNPSLTFEGENADVDRRTAGASLALDLGGKRRARAAEGDAALRVSEAGYALERRDVAIQWLKAWCATRLAARQSGLGRQRVDLMQRFDRLAAQRLAVGDIGSTERDLAALALGEAQIQQASLAGQEAMAHAALEAVDVDAASTLPPFPTALPPEPAAVAPLPADIRPEMVEARAGQERAEAGVVVVERARRPDPTLSLTGGHVRDGARSDRVFGLSVSIPLPVLNTGRAEIAAAHAEADAASANRRAVLLRSQAALRQQEATYGALLTAARAFRGSRASALDERTALLERLWQAGEIGTSDYLVQLKQSLDTALSGLALESQAWQAWFDYLAAAGRLDDWIDGAPLDTAR
ncbi:cobalt-zinc-cadmium efflux system outer membrane protein [Luteibacter jiangsuensis]|uniref:Cobalt-zinc-cadmium efflux system outer membrane protein n=1 Tax=Luteibacter jiangsuensis TaxID=637577 RepID=A0ABT9SVG3_9GAMM|nr:TolC family protein [Luteibacter jiangsuensis]MDQ0007992.1 cobalt-zinc-cadmium efflux system outer membrane protein [Luteibacter jiangsuensis]